MNYSKKYLNFDFFKEINSEIKAYLLGFIFADGCIIERHERKEYGFKIDASEKDKKILHLFQQYLNPYSNILTVKSHLFDGKACKPTNNIAFRNKQLYIDLQNLGCFPRKTYLENSIPNINEKYVNHFIRGYFDGDGCISYSLSSEYKRNKFIKRNRFTFFIVSKKSKMLIDIQSFFKKQNINIKIYHDNKKDVYYLKTSGIETISKIYDILYYDSNFFFERKRNIFKKSKLILR